MITCQNKNYQKQRKQFVLYNSRNCCKQNSIYKFLQILFIRNSFKEYLYVNTIKQNFTSPDNSSGYSCWIARSSSPFAVRTFAPLSLPLALMRSETIPSFQVFRFLLWSCTRCYNWKFDVVFEVTQ